MLAPICAMVLGQLCIPSEYAAVSETTGAIQQVLPGGFPRELESGAIARMGLYVEYQAEDNFGWLDGDLFRETCVDEICVVFQRFCRGDGTACAYQLGTVSEKDGVPGAWLSSYVVWAHTEAARKEAERRLFVVNPDKPSHGIPLSALTAHSAPARSGRYMGGEGWHGYPLD